MFFNPFPWWFILLVILPFRLLSFLTYLPVYPLKLVGLGYKYGMIHDIVWSHFEQFTLEPQNYVKHRKEIHKQIVIDAKEYMVKRKEKKNESK